MHWVRVSDVEAPSVVPEAASRPYAQPHAGNGCSVLDGNPGAGGRDGDPAVALLIVGMAVETTAGCATGIDESVMPAERTFEFEPMVVLAFGTRVVAGGGGGAGPQTVKDGRCTEHAPSAYRELCLPRSSRMYSPAKM